MGYPLQYSWAFQVAQLVKNPPAMQETWAWSLGWEGPLAQDWKRSAFIPIPKKGTAKGCSNYCTVALISHASKVMLKILQVRLQQYMNQELPDVQVRFRKGRGSRDRIANIHWLTKKQENFIRTPTFASLTMLKPLTVWITTNCGKFLKRWEYYTT